MLKNIDPLLAPDLLKVLCEMGHGDEIVLADANFTAQSLGRGKPIIRLPGVGMREACAAVLSVLPLDAAVAQPVAFMQVSDTPEGYRTALQREVIGQMCARGDAQPSQCEAVERFAFYDRVGRAYAIVQTGEMQAFANFVFKKGVIAHALVP
ncbi:RbsD/FucU domain-containing protein [Variovorax humicola]|uniref:RbsD/FucU domain-containing protein n=1 Tax=Variovorax humicola TaxID=1769758 RepID=A0ABU8VX36_9BURK